MTVTPLKSMFGEKLRNLLIASPLRQRDIAEALDVSNSAVSQMLSGKIVPQHEQLGVICEKLHLDRDQVTELTAMLARIRNGERVLRSQFNQLLFSARCERGLELPKLANLTGVSASRLQVLETCFGAIPTLEEINKLAPVLSCSPEDMLISAGLARPKVSGSAVSVGEVSQDFKTPKRMLPLLQLDQLKDLKSSGESLFGFAARVALRQTGRGVDLSVPAIAVTGEAKELQLGSCGEVTLLISVDRPIGFREIELCLDGQGMFFLRERIRGAWRVFRLTGGEEEKEPGYASLSLPVLELTLRPVRPGAIDLE